MAGLNRFAKRDRHERRWRAGGRLDDRNSRRGLSWPRCSGLPHADHARLPRSPDPLEPARRAVGEVLGPVETGVATDGPPVHDGP